MKTRPALELAKAAAGCARLSSPWRGNRSRMLAVLERAKRENRGYVEFMTHSSELMPGASPYFPDAESVEELYRSLEALFAHASRDFHGQTLAEFREGFDA